MNPPLIRLVQALPASRLPLPTSLKRRAKKFILNRFRPMAALLALAVPLAGQAQVRYPGGFGVVDVIPNNQSGESANNGEPSIGPGSGPNSGQIVVHSFAGFAGAPQAVFSSSDFGFHWSLVQNTYDGDATVDWNAGDTTSSASGSMWGPTAYIAMLLNGVGPISIWSSEGIAGGALGGPNVPFSPLAVLSGVEDQPWLRVVTVNNQDHIYVCSTDHVTGRSARNWFSLDGGHTWHGPIVLDPVTPNDMVPARLDLSPDGMTVYAAFLRETSFPPSGDIVGNVVVVRDDNSGLDSYQDLPNNGTVAAQNVLFPYSTSLAGQRLLGAGLAIAVTPTRPNQVWVAYGAVNASGNPVINVQCSQDSGQTFPYAAYTTDLALVDAAAMPALAVAADGTVGLMYLAKKGNNVQVRIFKAAGGKLGANGQLSSTSDQVLASFPATAGILNGNPWVGDYFQLKTVGNDFYGIFSAWNNPQPANFPSGVYFQRNVNVGGILQSNFWLSSPGSLVDGNGYPVSPSMDPFFYYSVGGTLIGLSTNKVHLKTFATIYPQVKFQSGLLEAFADMSNNPPVLDNGELVLPYDRSQPLQFFRASQPATNAVFQIFASADANGTLSPMGIVMVPGTSNQTFTAAANANYAIGNWILDGKVAQIGGSALTLSNVMADHSLLVTFPASNDLAVTIFSLSSDPENPDFVGSNLTYVAEFMNDGLSPLTDVTISNLFDPTVTYISATASQGSVAYANGWLTGNLGGLAPGAEATVTMVVQPQSCGSITDIVSAACDQFEPNLDNNTAVDVSAIWGTDLAIYTQPQSQVVDAGATVSFTVYADACPSVITYQWNFNGVPIFDATGSTLTLTNVTGAAAGQYDVTVQQTAGGPEDWQQVESDPATLTVITGPSAPAVVTEAASPVEYTVAGLNGTILPNGLDTTYWFTWGTDTTYGQSTAPSVVTADNTSLVNVQGGISGLASGTTYHCQLYGSNIDGITSGGDVTFTTPIPPPPAVVVTLAPADITSSSALLQGTINGEGSLNWLGYFQWGTTTSYGNNTPTFYYSGGLSGPNATYPESAAISGLAPNMTYHYRLVSYNQNPNEALGNDVTFSTSGSVTQAPPTATTMAASAINSTGATLNGTVNPNSADAHSYYQYGTTTAYGNTTAVSDVGAGNTAISLPYAIGGLAPNTLYHYQIVAYNSGGTSLGADLTFTTGAPAQAPPTAQTLAASSVTATFGILNGTVNPNGAETHSYFEYGTNTAYGNEGALSDVGSGSSAIPLQNGIGSLTPNTAYHYRIVAYNSGGTSYGGDTIFTTAAGQTPPAVATLAASSVTASSAVLNLSANPNGASSTVYFLWGATTSYGNITTQAGIGTTSQSDFTASLTGLAPNTTYHFQAVAVNSGGTSQGADVSFNTLPLPPSVTTAPASNNGGEAP